MAVKKTEVKEKAKPKKKVEVQKKTEKIVLNGGISYEEYKSFNNFYNSVVLKGKQIMGMFLIVLLGFLIWFLLNDKNFEFMFLLFFTLFYVVLLVVSSNKNIKEYYNSNQYRLDIKTDITIDQDWILMESKDSRYKYSKENIYKVVENETFICIFISNKEVEIIVKSKNDKKLLNKASKILASNYKYEDYSK